MKIFAFTLILFSSGFLFAQGSKPDSTKGEPEVEVELKVGDSMEIGKTKGETYKHLDYFKKTRWAGNEVPYDTATGNGFYKNFFTSGDFDVYELPADYKGKRFVIMGMEMLVNKDTKEDMPVLYLLGPDPNSIIWVDFNKALDGGELGLPSKLKK